MDDLLRRILSSQYEAALCMLHQCAAACSEEHWEGVIANDTFRQIIYHTLFYTDYYLSPSEGAFVLRPLHERGGDERGEHMSPGLGKVETLEYVAVCRVKAAETLAGESGAVLEGPSGFEARAMARAELHVYNIRHIQHHAGQLSAYLRRVDADLRPARAPQLRWVGQGWR